MSVGFPTTKTSFKLTKQSHGASDNLDHSLAQKSAENLHEESLRASFARREKARLDKLAFDLKKQGLSEQFLRNKHNKQLLHDKKREDANASKLNSINKAKRDLKADMNKKVENSHVDFEAREQSQIDYLRYQADLRNLNNLGRQVENERKEEEKKVYKLIKI